MFTKFDVLETIDMVAKEHLDIRTITMGISLFPCVRDTAEETALTVEDVDLTERGDGVMALRGLLTADGESAALEMTVRGA